MHTGGEGEAKIAPPPKKKKKFLCYPFLGFLTRLHLWGNVILHSLSYPQYFLFFFLLFPPKENDHLIEIVFYHLIEIMLITWSNFTWSNQLIEIFKKPKIPLLELLINCQKEPTDFGSWSKLFKSLKYHY